ncbi:small peptidoglycan-associated lipoprotein [Robertmurraya andreesenii]|uniref:Small peptidoglycan-associated lipoprotein n=1 Tax=Anoxybacillus andreesenii TaxID=1325932 RepID=A0ABT9V4K2_9BACL|nr:small peptidoglycan-associated lipoprotein [Robertmurraya andreesenii]MDQ0155852.1 hypothetical protein [Robertmurraya andreesenii]
MRVLPVIMIILSLVTACQHSEDANLQFERNIKQVVFLSNESKTADLQIEAPYYDAIIELRQQFPEEFRNMKTMSPNKAGEHLSVLKGTDCPALIVVYNEKIVAKVDGENTKEDIIQPITAALSN